MLYNILSDKESNTPYLITFQGSVHMSSVQERGNRFGKTRDRVLELDGLLERIYNMILVYTPDCTLLIDSD